MWFLIHPSFEPPDSDFLVLIKFPNIWLDIEKRRAIEHIDVLDIKAIADDFLQPNYRQPDSVGPPRGPGGEQPVLRIVKVWRHLQAIPFRFVEKIYQVNMRKTVKIAQAFSVGRVDFD